MSVLASRVARAAAALAVAAAGLLIAAPVSAGSAVLGQVAAGSHGGYCTSADQDAVTLVVDYQDLGGGTEIRCAAGLRRGATGYDALQAAGVSVAGTVHDGPGYVCRLNGRPSASLRLPIAGNDSYTEQCVNTPPTSAYWGYWWASPGGGWTYSSAGAMSHRVAIGGFEGWSFSHNASGGSNPAPGVAPVLPAPPPTTAAPPSTTKAAPVTTAAPPPSTTKTAPPSSTSRRPAATSRAAAPPPASPPAGGDDDGTSATEAGTTATPPRAGTAGAPATTAGTTAAGAEPTGSITGAAPAASATTAAATTKAATSKAATTTAAGRSDDSQHRTGDVEADDAAGDVATDHRCRRSDVRLGVVDDSCVRVGRSGTGGRRGRPGRRRSGFRPRRGALRGGDRADRRRCSDSLRAVPTTSRQSVSRP